MREENLLKIASISQSCLAGAGFRLEACTDLGGFEGEMRKIGKPVNHPMLSTGYHDFATDDAFCLYIISETGGIVAGLSACLMALGRDNLEDHWKRSYSRYYTNNGVSPAISRTIGARDIAGRVVYLGELFAHKDWRGKQIDMQAVMLYMQALSALKWTPDWLWAFMRISDIGRAPLYGFSRQYLGAHVWRESVARRSEQECLVAVPYDELCDAAEFYLRNPDAMISRQMC